MLLGQTDFRCLPWPREEDWLSLSFCLLPDAFGSRLNFFFNMWNISHLNSDYIFGRIILYLRELQVSFENRDHVRFSLRCFQRKLKDCLSSSSQSCVTLEDIRSVPVFPGSDRNTVAPLGPERIGAAVVLIHLLSIDYWYPNRLDFDFFNQNSKCGGSDGMRGWGYAVIQVQPNYHEK